MKKEGGALTSNLCGNRSDVILPGSGCFHFSGGLPWPRDGGPFPPVQIVSGFLLLNLLAIAPR